MQVGQVESQRIDQAFDGSCAKGTLIHTLRSLAWPESRAADVWRADAINFRAQAADRFAPSMRQRIDLARIYRQARRAVPQSIDGQAPPPLPEICPFTLDALLSED